MSEREWTRWSREAAGAIERTPETVAPPAGLPDEEPAPDRHVWDTWPLRDRQGSIATIGGWRVVFSLTSPADVAPGARHDIAEIRYFVSRDGRGWGAGGPLFEADALGTRQWAGSALYDDGEIYFFYTAAGDEETEAVTYTQRLAVGHGGTIEFEEGTPTIQGPWSHEILLEPDGEWYETQAQSGKMTYTFRDPWFFEDPNTGETHLLFESNTPAAEGDCSGDANKQAFNGCVGLAVSPTGDLLDWEFRPPIFDSVCVNQEIERPHLVVKEGNYYLLVSSHVDTFAPGLAGYDALYGFVADSLRGEYRPLNDSGLVVTNPATAPFQAYSWLAVEHGDELLVQGFLNYPEYGGGDLAGIADMSEAEQRQQFAGTLTPTLRLGVEGDRTRIQGTLDHWHIPAKGEELAVLDDDFEIEAADLDPKPGRTPTGSRREEGPYW